MQGKIGYVFLLEQIIIRPETGILEIFNTLVSYLKAALVLLSFGWK